MTITTHETSLLELWEEGVERWGEAFVAYTTLATLELHSHDVLANFEDVYVASFASLEEFLNEQLRALGWSDALDRLKRDEGISDEFLDWNYDALLQQARLAWDIVEKGGTIHVFST